MNIPKSFYVVLSLALLVVVVIASVLFLYVEIEIVRLGNVAQTISGTLGIAVALAGSLAAIAIAASADNIVRQQNERNKTLELTQLLEQAIQPYLKASSAFSAFLTYSVLAHQKQKDLVEKYTDQYQKARDSQDFDDLSKPIEESLEYTTSLSSILIKLSESLDEISTNTLSSYLWNKLNKNYVSQGIVKSISENPASISHILNIIAMRMRDSGAHSISKVFLPSILINKHTKNISEFYGNASLGTMIFASVELLPSDTHEAMYEDVPSRKLQGADILCDLYNCLQLEPDIIKEAFSEAYPKLEFSEALETIPLFTLLSHSDGKQFFSSDVSMIDEYVKFRDSAQAVRETQ